MTALRVVIVNNWHDDNKGDCAIILGMLNLLFHNLSNVQISIVSMFEDNDPRFSGATRFVRRSFPKVTVIGSPLPRIDASGHQQGNMYLRGLWILLLSFVRLVKPGQNEALIAIRKAHIVISQGGHIFHAKRSGLMGLFHFYWVAFPLVFARIHGKPYGFFSQSIGPFAGIGAKVFIRWLIRGASFVFVREDISLSKIEKIVGSSDQCYGLVPDAAFFMESKCNPGFVERLLNKYGLETGKFLAVTVRPWWHFLDSKIQQQKRAEYIDKIAKIIKQWIQRTEMPVSIIIQSLGPTVDQDDRLVARPLVDVLYKTGIGSDKIFLIEEDLSPQELRLLYGKSRVLLGTRLHSAILAFCEGTPCVVISYFGPKARGIMGQLGMSEYVFDIENFDPDEVFKAIIGLDICRNQKSSMIQNRVQNLLYTSRENIENFLHQISSEE